MSFSLSQHKKWSFPLTADLVTFTEEIFNGKLHFLRSVSCLFWNSHSKSLGWSLGLKLVAEDECSKIIWSLAFYSFSWLKIIFASLMLIDGPKDSSRSTRPSINWSKTFVLSSLVCEIAFFIKKFIKLIYPHSLDGSLGQHQSERDL